MAIVYRVDVSPVITAWGLMHFEKTGERHVLSDGHTTVIDGNGGQPAEGWHGSRRDAYLEAAEYVRKIAGTLTKQAERFEMEAGK